MGWMRSKDKGTQRSVTRKEKKKQKQRSCRFVTQYSLEGDIDDCECVVGICTRKRCGRIKNKVS